MSINEKLEILLGKKRKLFIYVQCWDGKQIQINLYYYDREPYDSSPLGKESQVLGMAINLRL